MGTLTSVEYRFYYEKGGVEAKNREIHVRTIKIAREPDAYIHREGPGPGHREGFY